MTGGPEDAGNGVAPREDERPGSPRSGATEGAPAPEAGEELEPVVRCDLCGGAMLERHCRLVCTNCGYQRDCSDP